MAIRRIVTSSPFRALSANPFERNGTSCSFGRRTLIYGRNGSGKTTLSEILRLAATAGTADGVTVKVSVGGGTTNGQIVLDESFGWKLFVYNRFYVEESLGVFIDGTGGSPPISVKLGVENVKAEAELEVALSDIARMETRLSAIKAKTRELERDSSDVEREVQTSTINDLSAGDASYYNPTRFTVAFARRQLNSSEGKKLPPEKLQTTIDTAVGVAIARVSLPETWPGVDGSLATTINNDLLSASVESEPIARLTNSIEVGDWVESGLALHTPGEICKFCEQGVINADLLDRYRQHFSAALENLREQLREAIEDITSRDEAIDAWVKALPDADDLLPARRTAILAERDRIVGLADELRSELAVASDRIRGRLADPLHPVIEEKLLSAPFLQIDTGTFHGLLEKHNSDCNSQVGLRDKARIAVELHHASRYRAEYLKLAARQAAALRAEESIALRLNSLRRAVDILRNSQQDTMQMATYIDADLREHFNHYHLNVTSSPDGKSYVVRREGKPAERLSEGERNSLALTYFLRRLEADGVQPSSSIVVIDDAITSLDKEALFSAFSLVTQRTTAFAQSVFLTHDFEFFRLLLNDHRSRRERSEKKIREGNVEEAAFPAVSVLELVPEINQATLSRTCSIRAVPKALLQHPSEYHYLFHKIALAVEGTDSAELPLLGNAARRLLEGFISFRAPAGKDFQTKVDLVVSESSISEALAKRVVKFLHGQSHREEPRPSAGLDFPAVEQELQMALSFIRLADRRHFSGMCSAVNIDEATLTTKLAQPVAQGSQHE